MPADAVMARPCQPFMGVSRSAASSSSADADIVDVSDTNLLDTFAAQSSYVPSGHAPQHQSRSAGEDVKMDTSGPRSNESSRASTTQRSAKDDNDMFGISALSLQDKPSSSSDVSTVSNSTKAP